MKSNRYKYLWSVGMFTDEYVIYFSVFITFFSLDGFTQNLSTITVFRHFWFLYIFDALKQTHWSKIRKNFHDFDSGLIWLIVRPCTFWNLAIIWPLANLEDHKAPRSRPRGLCCFDALCAWCRRCYSVPKPSLKIGLVNKAFLFWYWQRLKTFFFGINLLFFEIEDWNFQNLFEKEFRETSIRKPIEKMKIKIVWILSWISWNLVRFHEIQFQTDAESFSSLSWKTKKFYS